MLARAHQSRSGRRPLGGVLPWVVGIFALIACALTPVGAAAQNTTTTVTGTPNPSALGQPVTFTAVVTAQGGGPTPTGSVQFLDGLNVMGTAPLDASGHAVFTTAGLLNVGQHTIIALYQPTGTFNQSFGSTTQTLTQGSTTTTTLVSSQNPSALGQAVTFTATVTGSGGGTPTG